MELPILFEIKSSLEDIIRQAAKEIGIIFARKLLANIILRFTDSEYWELPLYKTAMLLNPRFKDTLLSNKNGTSLPEKENCKRKNSRDIAHEIIIRIQSS